MLVIVSNCAVVAVRVLHCRGSIVPHLYRSHTSGDTRSGNSIDSIGNTLRVVVMVKSKEMS